MSKNTFENSKLQLEVTNYCITEDGTTLIELSVRNHAQITRIEDEYHCFHTTEFDKQISSFLLFSCLSKSFPTERSKRKLTITIKDNRPICDNEENIVSSFIRVSKNLSIIFSPINTRLT